ncbi:hypothetical protein HID58_014162, partial [Brassica napus]
ECFSRTPPSNLSQEEQPLGPRCSIDASWHQDAVLFGGGMVLTDEDGVKIIKDEKEDDWPSLSVEFEEFYHLHSMFNFCFICFILRSCNVRADSLAKGVRSCGLIFSIFSNWMDHTNYRETS